MEEKYTMCNVIISFIENNQLSPDEEIKIKEVLLKRERKREEERFSRCLAGIIISNMEHEVSQRILKESSFKRYKPIWNRYFNQSVFGNMDASLLTEESIEEFILQIIESDGLIQNEYICFTKMLTTGLRKAKEKGFIDFSINPRIFKVRYGSKDELHLIENPYSDAEIAALLAFAEEHPEDERANACALFLLGGISSVGIINLRTEDFINDTNFVVIDDIDGEVAYGMTKERKRIIDRMIALHPDEPSVFMIKKDNRYCKLNGKSISIKLYYICEKLGITYRPIHKNDAVVTV